MRAPFHTTERTAASTFQKRLRLVLGLLAVAQIAYIAVARSGPHDQKLGSRERKSGDVSPAFTGATFPPSVASKKAAMADPTTDRADFITVPSSYSQFCRCMAPNPISREHLDEIFGWLEISAPDREKVKGHFDKWLARRQLIEAEHAVLVEPQTGLPRLEILAVSTECAPIDSELIESITACIGSMRGQFFREYFSKEFAGSAELRRLAMHPRDGERFALGLPSRAFSGGWTWISLDESAARERFGRLLERLGNEAKASSAAGEQPSH